MNVKCLAPYSGTVDENLLLWFFYPQMGCSLLHQSDLKGVNHFETIEPKKIFHYNSCTNKIEIRKGFLIVLLMIDGLYIAMHITFSRGQIQHNQTNIINDRHHMIYLLLYVPHTLKYISR